MPPTTPSWHCCEQQGPLALPTHLASLYAPLLFYCFLPHCYICGRSSFCPREGLGAPPGDLPDVLKPKQGRNRWLFSIGLKETCGLALWDFPAIYTLCGCSLKPLLDRASARECPQRPCVRLFSINRAQQILTSSDKFNLSFTLVVKKSHSGWYYLQKAYLCLWCTW